LDEAGGAGEFLSGIARTGPALGELGAEVRGGLLIALDERAESEALETEWKEAEELAAIVDGELTDVPGLDELKREIRGSGP